MKTVFVSSTFRDMQFERDAIERCHPYFVVILKNRYGFIPNAELLELEEAIQKKNFKLDDEESSITALEIEFGALSNSDQMKRTFFLFP